MIIKFKSGKTLTIPKDYYNLEIKQNGSVFEIDFETSDFDDDVRYTGIHYTIDISSVVSIEVNNG